MPKCAEVRVLSWAGSLQEPPPRVLAHQRLVRAVRNAPSRLAPALEGEGCYCVEIKPPVVTTIQRLPQRVIVSIRPTPGT